MGRRKNDRIKLDRMTVNAESLRQGDWVVMGQGQALMRVINWNIYKAGSYDPATVTIELITQTLKYLEGDRVNIWREVDG